MYNISIKGVFYVERLKELRQNRGKTQRAVANAIGVTQQAYANYESGKREPSYDILISLAEYYNVSVEDVLGIADKTPNYDEGNKNNEPVASNRKGVKIPVLGRVAAGIPFEAVEEILDYEEISPEMAKSGEFFALQIKGDSMEPKISDGDVVIVRRQSDADSGDTVIAYVNGYDATCKKLKKLTDGLMLIPSNPNHEPMFYSNNEINTFPVCILGKVVELRAKFN